MYSVHIVCINKKYSPKLYFTECFFKWRKIFIIFIYFLCINILKNHLTAIKQMVPLHAKENNVTAVFIFYWKNVGLPNTQNYCVKFYLFFCFFTCVLSKWKKNYTCKNQAKDNIIKHTKLPILQLIFSA